MSLSPVTSTFANYAQQVASGESPNPNTTAGSAQEAAESQATTLKEARAGDPVAKKKLLKEQAQAAQQQQAAQPAPSEPGKGELIDHAA